VFEGRTCEMKIEWEMKILREKKRVAMNEKKKNSVIKLREFKTPDKLTKCFFKN
jgi:hypothetical protein